MQHTCNTHATHMQHEHFPSKFPSKVAAGAKIYTFHSKTGVGAANVKSCTLTVNLQVKSSCCMSCCMCVACVLHVCCMCVACVLHVCCTGVPDRAVTLSKWRACHAERQPVHPTTLRNQVKKVSRLSLHVFHLALAQCAPHSRPCHLQVLRLPRCFLLPHFTGVICMGLPMQRTCNTHATHMQHTCNTHATHMQHTCNTSIFPVNFQAKWPRGQKSTLSILRPELGLQTWNPARWL